VRIGSQLAVAARAAVGVFAEGLAPLASRFLGGVFPGVAGQPPVRGTREFLRAYTTMPWLRAVTNRVADSVSAVRWQVFLPSARVRPSAARAVKRLPFAERFKVLSEMRQAGDLREVPDHQMLDVIDTGNSFLTGLTMRKVTQLHVDIVGDAFWMKERAGAGRVVGVWPIPPSWVLSTPTPANRKFRVQYRSFNEEIPDTEILWFSDPNPEHPYGRGTGTGFSLADELETDEYAAKMVRQLFYNMARPDFIAYVKGADEPTLRKMQLQWLQRHQGVFRQYLPRFVNREIDIHEFDNNDLRSMQFNQIRQHERDTIVQVFGVPPEIIGILSASNRATITAADMIYARWVLVPRLEFMRAIFQERFTPEFDERLVVGYVSPVQEDRDFQLEVFKGAPWVPSNDEWRALGGLQPTEDGTGKVHLVASNLVATEDLRALPVPAAPTLPAPAPPRQVRGRVLSANGDVTLHERRLAQDRHRLADAAATFRVVSRLRAGADPERGADEAAADLIARAAALDPDDLPALVALVAPLEPSMRRRFLGAAGAAQAATDPVALAALIAEGAPVSAVVDATALALKTFADRLEAGMPQDIARAFDAGGKHAARELRRMPETVRGLEIAFDRLNPRAVAWVRDRGAQLVREVSDGTRQAIRTIVAEAFEQGLAPRQAARLIRDVVGLTSRQAGAVASFEATLLRQGIAAEDVARRVGRYAEAQIRRRALLIARTETVAGANAGQQELWRQAVDKKLLRPAETKRKWIATHDDRLEPACESLDGKEVGLEEEFAKGVLHPPLHPSCRCAAGLVFSKAPTGQPRPPAPAAPPALAPQPRVPYQSQPTMAAALDQMRTRFPGVRWEDDLEGLDLHVMNRSFAQVDRMLTERPELTGQLAHVTASDVAHWQGKADTYAYVATRGRVSTMHLNPNYYARPAGATEAPISQHVRRDVLSGFHPRATALDAPGSMIVHEMGHVYDHALDAANDAVFFHVDLPTRGGRVAVMGVDGFGQVGETAEMWRTARAADLRSASRYAKKNAREAFAEAFADQQLTPAGTTRTRAARAVDDLLSTIGSTRDWTPTRQALMVSDLTQEERAIVAEAVSAAKRRLGVRP
jgi:SPP1 gp7 family putative phage head morphogenesis protein